MEAGRVVVIALASYLATDMVIGNLVDAVAGNQLSEPMKIQIVAIMTVVVKAIDRALHETVDEKGILRF